MMRRISYLCAAVTLGMGDQAVFSQSDWIVCADQVPCQVCSRSEIIVSSGRREFPQNWWVSLPVAPATSRGVKTSRENYELEMIYRVKRMGLVRIMRDMLTLASGYPRFESNDYYISRKVLSSEVFSQGGSTRADWWYSQRWCQLVPNTGGLIVRRLPQNGLVPRSLIKEGIQHEFRVLSVSRCVNINRPFMHHENLCCTYNVFLESCKATHHTNMGCLDGEL